MTSFEYFCKLSDYLYFGKYPCESVINELEQLGVNVFVDLTEDNDDLKPYNIKGDKIVLKIPVIDCYIMDDNELHWLLEYLKNLIVYRNKILYIHCRGGHGRSAVVAGILYGYCNDMNSKTVLETLSRVHSERRIVKDEWRRLGCPQTQSQKNQVIRFLK